MNISDKGAHRLVAVLLLFLYEGLGHNTPVLGLRPHKLYELIEHIVRRVASHGRSCSLKSWKSRSWV